MKRLSLFTGVAIAVLAIAWASLLIIEGIENGFFASEQPRSPFLDAQLAAWQIDEEQQQKFSQRLDEVPQTVDAVAAFYFGLGPVLNQQQPTLLNAQGELVMDQLVNRYEVKLSDDHHSDTKELFIAQKNTLQGIYDVENDKWLLNPDFQKIALSIARQGALELHSEQGLGLASKWGEVLVPAEYEQILPLDGRFYRVQKQGLWGIYDSEKQALSTPIQYTKLDYCGGCGNKPSYLYAEQQGKWGIITMRGEERLPFQYQYPSPTYKRGDNWVSNLLLDGQKVFINLASQEHYFSKDYRSVFLRNGFLVLRGAQGYQLINQQGHSVSKQFYQNVWSVSPDGYSSPYIGVKTPTSNLLLDSNGETLLQLNKKDTARLSVSQQFIEVHSKEAGYGLYDRDVQPLLDIKYAKISEHTITSGERQNINLYHLYNEAGERGWYVPSLDVVVEPQFDNVDWIKSPSNDEVYFLATTETDIELYSLSGEVVVPAGYDNLRFMSNGKVAVIKDDKVGMYDIEQNKELLPPDYFGISSSSFHPSLLKITHPAEQDFETQYWDTQTEQFMNTAYTLVTRVPDSKTVWLVEDEDAETAFLYDVATDKQLSNSYKKIYGFKKGWAKVKNHKGRVGFIDHTGKERIPLRYDHAEMNPQGIVELMTLKTHTSSVVAYNDDNGNGIQELVSLRIWHATYVRPSGEKLNPKPIVSHSEPHESIASTTPQYHDKLLIQQFNEDRQQDLLGMMSIEGELLIKPLYTQIYEVADGAAYVVISDDKVGIINQQGKMIVPPVLDDINLQKPIDRSIKAERWADKFPLLARLDSTYFHINADGSFAPFKAQSADFTGLRILALQRSE